MSGRAEDLQGRRFTRLVVVRRAENKGLHAAWFCRCDCGREVVVAAQHLKDGSTKACGCLLRAALHQRKHNQHKTPEYAAWAQMLQRCNNVKNQSYRNYGGRGIKVCARWRLFENFIADMGRRPSTKHSLERRNNDGDYTPQNCIWATSKMQRNNSRQNVFITFEGETRTLKQWAEERNIKYSTLITRRLKGKPVEEILSTKEP